MPITLTFHFRGITISIKLSIAKSVKTQKSEKQNRHSAQ